MRSAVVYTISYYKGCIWAALFYAMLFIGVACLVSLLVSGYTAMAMWAISSWLVSFPLSFCMGVWTASVKLKAVMTADKMELTGKSGISRTIDLDLIDEKVGYSGIIPAYITINSPSGKQKLYGKLFLLSENKPFSEMATAIRMLKMEQYVLTKKHGDESLFLQSGYILKENAKDDDSSAMALIEFVVDVADDILN